MRGTVDQPIRKLVTYPLRRLWLKYFMLLYRPLIYGGAGRRALFFAKTVIIASSKMLASEYSRGTPDIGSSSSWKVRRVEGGGGKSLPSREISGFWPIKER